MLPFILWLVLSIVFFIIEECTCALVSVWFSFGAVIAAILSLFTDNYVLQIGIFLFCSILFLLALRRFAKKALLKPITKTNADRLIGETGIVTETIQAAPGNGAALFKGMEWTCKSEDGSCIEKGTKVSLIRIEGVTAIVKIIKGEEK